MHISISAMHFIRVQLCRYIKRHRVVICQLHHACKKCHLVITFSITKQDIRDSRIGRCSFEEQLHDISHTKNWIVVLNINTFIICGNEN